MRYFYQQRTWVKPERVAQFCVDNNVPTKHIKALDNGRLRELAPWELNELDTYCREWRTI